MKSELMNIPGKGICIIISEINPNDFVYGEGISFYNGGVFKDIFKIADEIRRGKKIAAIKECREQTGWGLKEAKKYMDKYIFYGVTNNDNDSADKFIQDHMPKDFLENDEFKL